MPRALVEYLFWAVVAYGITALPIVEVPYANPLSGLPPRVMCNGQENNEAHSEAFRRIGLNAAAWKEFLVNTLPGIRANIKQGCVSIVLVDIH